MAVLAGIAALVMATCGGYYFGRRAGSTPPTWKQRTSRMALGKLAISLLALTPVRRIRRSYRAEHALLEAVGIVLSRCASLVNAFPRANPALLRTRENENRHVSTAGQGHASDGRVVGSWR